MAGRKPQRRSEFGTVCRLASGRWQARYLGPDGQRHTAPETFDTETDAQDWLNLVRQHSTAKHQRRLAQGIDAEVRQRLRESADGGGERWRHDGARAHGPAESVCPYAAARMPHDLRTHERRPTRPKLLEIVRCMTATPSAGAPGYSGRG